MALYAYCNNNGNAPLTATGAFCQIGKQVGTTAGNPLITPVFDYLDFLVIWTNGAAGGTVQIVSIDLQGTPRTVHWIHGATNYVASGQIIGPFIGTNIFFTKAANNINFAQLIATQR